MTTNTFLFSLFLFPVFIVFVHSVLNRTTTGNPQVIALRAILASIVVYLLLLTVFAADITGCAYFLIYGLAVSYSYFHLFNMSETARRIKILISVRKNKNSTYNDLLQTYREDSIVHLRLKRLEEMNQIHKIQERFVLKSKILFLPAAFTYWYRDLIGLNKHGV